MSRALTPSQLDVLRELARNPGLTPEALAAATSLPVGGVGWNLSQLEGRGFVEHELVRTDGELNGVYRLTERGLAAFAQLDR
jgi:DNA-binding MarR family transcriptional regulator